MRLGLALADPVLRLDDDAGRPMVVGLDHLGLVERQETPLALAPAVAVQLEALSGKVLGLVEKLGVVGLVEHPEELDAPRVAARFAGFVR